MTFLTKEKILEEVLRIEQEMSPWEILDSTGSDRDDFLAEAFYHSGVRDLAAALIARLQEDECFAHTEAGR